MIESLFAALSLAALIDFGVPKATMASKTERFDAPPMLANDATASGAEETVVVETNAITNSADCLAEHAQTILPSPCTALKTATNQLMHPAYRLFNGAMTLFYVAQTAFGTASAPTTMTAAQPPTASAQSRFEADCTDLNAVNINENEIKQSAENSNELRPSDVHENVLTSTAATDRNNLPPPPLLLRLQQLPQRQ